MLTPFLPVCPFVQTPPPATMSAVENYEDKKDYETEGPSSGSKFETDAAAYVQAVDEKGVLSARAGVHEARLKRG